MVEIVNVVASGALDAELDLERLADDIGEPVARYDPEKYPGMYLRFEEDAPLITVYRTGKFIITGADSEEESYSFRERFLNLFSDMDVIERPENKWFSIQNYVCTAELGQNLNLNALVISLGLEKTEYEPEQFPGLIYRPDNGNCVILVFATGKVVITGSKQTADAECCFADFKNSVYKTL
ncbi:TATA-box-binding protein [Halomicroarcula sp. F13]|uniref:TATA-box-binding protein n=1 Tax=Haloarcula rubra TaxID=2487747 RepID=A0AAW4PV36_9EURY|nr:TATA-box-binding protein [Halomicroarcula rubra]MBX0325181.1 TATA-box-binding protein [Halomicroarcula rubra]